MSRATSPSAIPLTSSGWSTQTSAICSKVREVLSTSQTAVALGIRLWVIIGLGSLVLKTKAPDLAAGREDGLYRRDIIA